MQFDIDIVCTILPFLTPRSACMLARASKSLNELLKEIAQTYKRGAYERLCCLDTATDFFSVRRMWRQFNALYIVRKEMAIKRRIRRARVTVREFQFGFYTGRKDEWHHCYLSLPPFGANLGARLRVASFDRNDERIVTRTFESIFSVDALIGILETRYWHSEFYCVCASRWSYIEGEPSPVLVLGFEE